MNRASFFCFLYIVPVAQPWSSFKENIWRPLIFYLRVTRFDEIPLALGAGLCCLQAEAASGKSFLQGFLKKYIETFSSLGGLIRKNEMRFPRMNLAGDFWEERGEPFCQPFCDLRNWNAAWNCIFCGGILFFTADNLFLPPFSVGVQSQTIKSSNSWGSECIIYSVWVKSCQWTSGITRSKYCTFFVVVALDITLWKVRLLLGVCVGGYFMFLCLCLN